MRPRLKTDETDDRKRCPRCHKIMAKNWANELCPACTDEDLYKQVKEYITKNDVTATEVAMIFDIPLQKVNAWIKEGFLEYRKNHYF